MLLRHAASAAWTLVQLLGCLTTRQLAAHCLRRCCRGLGDTALARDADCTGAALQSQDSAAKDPRGLGELAAALTAAATAVSCCCRSPALVRTALGQTSTLLYCLLLPYQELPAGPVLGLQCCCFAGAAVAFAAAPTGLQHLQGSRRAGQPVHCRQDTTDVLVGLNVCNVCDERMRRNVLRRDPLQ